MGQTDKNDQDNREPAGTKNKGMTNSEMNPYVERKGLCIILNQQLFYPDPNIPNSVELGERSWTDEDRNILRETFTTFGADCFVFNDQTRGYRQNERSTAES